MNINNESKKYYVYRFLDKENKILYVGQTTNMNSRMKAHFIYQRKEYADKIEKVEYKEYDYRNEMSIYEIYYINKFVPKYNADFNLNEPMDYVKEDNKEWNTYNHKELNEHGVMYIDSKDIKTEIKNYFNLPLNLFAKSKFKKYCGTEFLIIIYLLQNKDKGWIEGRLISKECGLSEGITSNYLRAFIKENLLLLNKGIRKNGEGNSYKLNKSRIHKNSGFKINNNLINISFKNEIKLTSLDIKLYLYIAREIESKEYKYEDFINKAFINANIRPSIKRLEKIGLLKVYKEKNCNSAKNIYELI